MNMALALAVALAAPSCAGKDDEELFTQGEVTVCPPEGVVMERFQATMVFENVNTRQRTSTSDFTEGVLDIRLLRGLYRLSIAEGGGMTYTEDGTTRFGYVTVDSSPVDLTAENARVDVSLILKK